MSELFFWYIQIPGWVLVVYLAVAQCLSAVSYDIGVRMGTQEPASHVTEAGVAFWKGFAGADLVVYTPLLAAGLAGHALAAPWAGVVLGAGLGITVYWPVVCLWAVCAARGAAGWTLPNERSYWRVLPALSLWAAGGLAGLALL